MSIPGNFKLLYSPEQIRGMTAAIAKKIDAHYKQAGVQDIVCVGVLKGAWMFHADLVREIQTNLTIDFIRATSYGHGTESSGTVRILKDIEADIRGKHLLLIEEIIDSGRTLAFIRDRLISGGAASVKVAALLDKKERRVVEFEGDFVGSVVPNHFVVGYGLDWAERYRNLDGVYVVTDEKLK